MNKIILALAICLLSTIYSNAQWYQRSCGVTDINNTTSEEFECMWGRAKEIARTGARITAIGTSSMIVGVGVILIFNPTLDSDLFRLAGFLFLGGALMDIIGVPVWLTGVERKFQLRKNPHYQNLNLGSLNLSPVIGLNHTTGTQYLGTSFLLNF